MYPECSLQKQAGAGLPIALFIITVLALIVVGMSQLQESSGKSISLQIQSQRAFFAAESGAQVALTQVLASDSCSTVSSAIDFSVSGLSACSAALTCTSLPTPPSGTTSSPLLLVTSIGQCGSVPEQAERIVEVVVR